MKLFVCNYLDKDNLRKCCSKEDGFIDFTNPNEKNVLDNVASTALTQLPSVLMVTAVAALFFGVIFNKINLPFKKMLAVKISAMVIFSISSIVLTPIFSILPAHFISVCYQKMKRNIFISYNLKGDTIDDETENRCKYTCGKINAVAFCIMQSISQIIALCIAAFFIIPKCSSYSLISKTLIIAASVFFPSFFPSVAYAFAEFSTCGHIMGP